MDDQRHPGILALVGGDEFHRGNEPIDNALVAAARPGPAYVVASAAARQHPERAAGTGARWFAGLGVTMTELRVRTAADSRADAVAVAARTAGLAYLCGGDPGLVASLLRDSPAGRALVDAWSAGAALAGSSAGAMALCEHVLVRQGFPGHAQRRPVAGMGVVPGAAVLPHHDTFGERWLPSARAALPEAVLIGVDERTAAVWEAGVWRALGSGAVTVHRPDGSARFAAGDAVTGIPEPRSASPRT
jgi:cyanophycinase